MRCRRPLLQHRSKGRIFSRLPVRNPFRQLNGPAQFNFVHVGLAEIQTLRQGGPGCIGCAIENDRRQIIWREIGAQTTSAGNLQRVGGKILTASLANNETARDFASVLPLNVTMKDLFGREKYGDLPKRFPKTDRAKTRMK